MKLVTSQDPRKKYIVERIRELLGNKVEVTCLYEYQESFKCKTFESLYSLPTKRIFSKWLFPGLNEFINR